MSHVYKSNKKKRSDGRAYESERCWLMKICLLFEFGINLFEYFEANEKKHGENKSRPNDD